MAFFQVLFALLTSSSSWSDIRRTFPPSRSRTGDRLLGLVMTDHDEAKGGIIMQQVMAILGNTGFDYRSDIFLNLPNAVEFFQKAFRVFFIIIFSKLRIAPRVHPRYPRNKSLKIECIAGIDLCLGVLAGEWIQNQIIAEARRGGLKLAAVATVFGRSWGAWGRVDLGLWFLFMHSAIIV